MCLNTSVAGCCATRLASPRDRIDHGSSGVMTVPEITDAGVGRPRSVRASPPWLYRERAAQRLAAKQEPRSMGPPECRDAAVPALDDLRVSAAIQDLAARARRNGHGVELRIERGLGGGEPGSSAPRGGDCRLCALVACRIAAFAWCGDDRGGVGRSGRARLLCLEQSRLWVAACVRWAYGWCRSSLRREIRVTAWDLR
jgi:hypothetical protein